MAVAGIVLGWLGIVLSLIVAAVIAVVVIADWR
jgi:hypothetical protein